MPPRKRASNSRTPTRPTRRSARQRATVDNDVASIYGDMLAEAVAEERAHPPTPRSSKRRKLSEEPAGDIQLDVELFGSSQFEPLIDLDNGAPITGEPAEAPRPQQVVYDDFEESDESDVEFEEVDLEPSLHNQDDSQTTDQTPLQLDLSTKPADSSRHGVQRRKPVGPAERKRRLEVHKAHLICLLAHLSARNRWCESDAVQSILKPLIPRKLVSLFHVDESKPQFQRSHSFNKGLEEICLLWRTSWTISARGMCRAHWKEDVDALKESENAEDLIDFDDFKSAAHSKTGSRDLGAQLLCALLRSIAVDARLVCSLQVLPFSGVAKGQTPEKPKPKYHFAPTQNYDSAFSRPQRPAPSKKRIIESPFPIFWVEVFSPSTSNWIPIDPLVRNTINKPKTGFEPPASDGLNSMTYVIAFEDDGSAKDVTRRYTQWFNAKTRKQRVESTKNGQTWWNQTMTVFEKTFSEARDDIEDAELTKRAENEAMPRNVQDFKDHPVFVLERHLRMNEVIHPKHEVGKVTAGVSKNAKLESVFRRRDVHLCRSADAWYRRGKDVKEGEQPLKRVLSKRKRDANATQQQQQNSFDDDEGDPDSEGTALYAEYQTSTYVPPPVVDGTIPRNAYGNLDVYVPSMIPAGGVHIRHPLAMEAAKVLGINFAEAVTGFEFKGRQGTAVIDGVVVSADMCDAMINVIEGLESQATEESEQARTQIVLATWKRWLTALRVRDKVQREYGDREGTPDINKGIQKEDQQNEDNNTYSNGDASTSDSDYDDGGGFVTEDAEPAERHEEPRVGLTTAPNLKALPDILPPEIVHREIIVVRSPHKVSPPTPLAISTTSKLKTKTTMLDSSSMGDDYNGDGGGGFLLEDGDEEAEPGRPQSQLMNQPPKEPMSKTTKATTEMDTEEEGGGFVVEDDGKAEAEAEAGVEFLLDSHPINLEANDEEAGGFIVEDNETEATESVTATKTEQPEQQSPVQSPVVKDKNKDKDKLKIEEEPGPPRPATKLSSPPQSQSASPGSPNSLLSHDPDEDDAEPEWLLNSLGELE
ncbi:hypothetical protein PV10_06426 [Exophiala mesophila]|uniref:Rad4 beta-hairpin domain-containing protein n=1 Tax=Exophiala mesophila TaxID=212818 RepID=A0A0D1ZDD3_EXOME|nr:uncharacterized protein PV10_06426 [Exophiala mesophila]KIV91939.1 hypothetical protein PV10_06426 [Exophiala mesophila]